MDKKELDRGMRANDLLSLLESLNCIIDEEGNEKKKQHDFWSTQPVPQDKAELNLIQEDGPIDDSKLLNHEPIKLPEVGIKFSDFDVDSEEHLEELYVLLCENYVEDYDSLFRFEYSKEFLKWALKAPGWKKDWHVCIRRDGDDDENNKKMVGFICAIPCKFKVRRNEIQSVEVNFLCVEKSLRSKRLAPILIKEVTRRVNLTGIFQALYTAGVSLPEPIGTAQYYHRPLNFKKLLECNFTYLPPNKTINQMESYYKLSTSKIESKIRLLVESDLPRVMELLEIYLERFQLAHKFDLDECKHWFLPRDKVIYSFVILDERNDDLIVDFFSFYSIPSSILNQPEIPHKTIQVAYLFYYSVSSQIRLLPLMKTVLLEATKLGFDVLNCLNLMENDDKLLEALKFGAGDGQLRFYLYNWRTRQFKPNEIGFIML